MRSLGEPEKSMRGFARRFVILPSAFRVMVKTPPQFLAALGSGWRLDGMAG
jgi:hypothetical protein